MISTRTLSEMALAISTACCEARVRPRAGCARPVDVELGQNRFGLGVHLAPVQYPASILVADEDVLSHVQVGEDHGFLVDGGDAVPCASMALST